MKELKGRLLKILLAAAVAIATILLVDGVTPDITIAPLVGICVLFIAAWMLGPIQISVVLVAVSFIVAQQLYHPSRGGEHLDASLANVRLYSFICGGLIAVLFSAYRQRFERVRNEMSTLFGLLPIPVLIADSSGNIVFASESAIAMTGVAREKIIGAPVTDFVGTQLLEETEENWFQHWIQASESAPFRTEIRIGGVRTEARAMKIGNGSSASIALLLDDLPRSGNS